MVNFGLNSASVLAQVNFGANSASILGIFLAVAGAALYFLGLSGQNCQEIKTSFLQRLAYYAALFLSSKDGDLIQFYNLVSCFW